MVEHLAKQLLVRIASGQRDPPAPDGHSDHHADLEQLPANRVATSPRQFGARQAVRASGRQQHVGRAREPQPQLVGPPGVATGAGGEQAPLLFCDALFQFAAGAVALFVQRPRVPLRGRADHLFNRERKVWEASPTPISLQHRAWFKWRRRIGVGDPSHESTQLQ